MVAWAGTGTRPYMRPRRDNTLAYAWQPQGEALGMERCDCGLRVEDRTCFDHPQILRIFGGHPSRRSLSFNLRFALGIICDFKPTELTFNDFLERHHLV